VGGRRFRGIAGSDLIHIRPRDECAALAGPDEPALLATLTGIAAQVTGRALAVAEARAVRLHAGDYLLAPHDRVHDDHPVELILDLSAASVPGAEVRYRRGGQVFFQLASARALARSSSAGRR